MIRYTTFILALFALPIFSSCQKESLLTEEEKQWLVDHPNLKVSVFGYYPPYQFITEGNGQADVGGLFIDYLELIEKKIDYKFTRVRYEDDNWSGLYQDAMAGKLDIIVEIHKTESRLEHFSFYAELFDSNYVIVTRKENKEKAKFDSLPNLHLVLPKDYSINEIIRKKFPNIKISNEKSDEACLRALNEGEYDAYLGPGGTVFYINEREQFYGLRIGPEIPYSYTPGLAVSKQKPVLDQIIKKATQSVRQQELIEIYDHWLLKKNWPFYRTPDFWFMMLIFFVILTSIIIYANFRLKYKVRERTKDLREALEKTEQSDRVKTNFIHNISHEIRTPLNGIMGCAELLKDQNVIEVQRKDFMDVIITNGKNLINIIDNILEISTIQTKEPKLTWEVTKPHDFFHHLVQTFQARASKKNLELIYELLEKNDLPKLLLIDKVKLTKILKSLLDNAIKFTEKGFVKVNFRAVKNFLELEIIDTGVGIAEDEKQMIFDHFSQVDRRSSKKVSGLGLGLTIVKEHVLTLGGEISFQSKTNEGTNFRVSLPFRDVETKDITASPKQLINKKDTYQILIAEDEDTNFFLAQTTLTQIETLDLNISRAKSGEEAVEICKTENPDFVLMDILMPVMNGLDATKIVKAMKPELPIVAYTAYASDADIELALEAGCDDVIIKPTDPHDFAEKIKSYLR